MDLDFGFITITLPSGGKVYPKDSVLSSGRVELRTMNAEDENILTTALSKGVNQMLDDLMVRLSKTPFDPDDLVEGDRLALLIGMRVASYGPMLTFKYESTVTREEEEAQVNISELPDIPLGAEPLQPNINEFEYILPVSNKRITFKLVTGKISKDINKELEEMKKLYPNQNFGVTVRYYHTITSVDGNKDMGVIRDFCKKMPAFDSKMFRRYVRDISPDVESKVTISNDRYTEEGVEVPLSIVEFFFSD